MSHRRRTVVFIMATGHSGSTMLDLILGSHSRAFSLGELGSLASKMKAGELPSRLCGVCKKECELWDEREARRFLGRYFRGGAGRGWHRNLWVLFGAWRRDLYGFLHKHVDRPVLIDSGKRVSWIRRQLRPRWFWLRKRPVLVFLHRDGRGVISSYLRKYPDLDVETATRRWVRNIRSMERMYARFPAARRLRVAYEKLANDPENSVRELCERLQLEPEPGMLEYWRHPHHPLFGNERTISLIQRYRDGADAESPTDAFYAETGLSIRLDLRWRDELTEHQRRVFETIAGSANRPYAYREDAGR